MAKDATDIVTISFDFEQNFLLPHTIIFKFSHHEGQKAHQTSTIRFAEFRIAASD